MSLARVYAKSQSYGGRDPKRPGRKFQIPASSFTSSEQGVPIRLIRGTARAAGVYITPVFGFRAVETEVETEK